MIPAGFAGVEAQLWLWMVAMIRPGAAFLAAPVFGASLRAGAAAADHRARDRHPGACRRQLRAAGRRLASIEGFLLVGGEVLAGLRSALPSRSAFPPRPRRRDDQQRDGPRLRRHGRSGERPAEPDARPVPVDPRHLPVPAIGGHLALAATIVESYRALPPGDAWLSARASAASSMFGGVLFAAGLSIALPVGFAIILVQIVMGVLARSAPQLNLFSVGLPAALLAGIVLLAIAAPVMGEGHHRRPSAGAGGIPHDRARLSHVGSTRKGPENRRADRKRLPRRGQEGRRPSIQGARHRAGHRRGRAWLALAGPMLVGSLEDDADDGLSFGAADVRISIRPARCCG
jgi:flagellar biosynthetic protein FliR